MWLRILLQALSVVVVVGVLLGGVGWAILTQAKFGAQPAGERLEKIRSSPNYINGEFANTVPTLMLVEGESSLNIMWKGLFAKKINLRPAAPLPSHKMDLKALDKNTDMVIWLGHSSSLIQLGGKRILVDPVFSGYGAPFSFLNKSFAGTEPYTVDDLPDLDVLLISHDHWDHLDSQTALELLPKVRTVILPLGVGAHLERWGYPKEKLREADWNTALPLEYDSSKTGDLTVHVVPARHYSGRTFTRNKALWAGFVLETPERRIFLSGDTGYGPHFTELASRFGSFDLVMLDGGQYDPRWPLIHMTPEEAVLAASELGAKSMILSHVGKFAIASHAWDEPFERAVKSAQSSADTGFQLLTPLIGEPVFLNDTAQTFGHWWKTVPTDGAN